MKGRRLMIVGTFLLFVLFIGVPAVRASAYVKLTTIPIPMAAGDVDIAWVDPGSHIFYVADRLTHGIDMIDTINNTFLGTIGGFVGAQSGPRRGPSGVMVIADRNELWAGDGDSTVKVVDRRTHSVVATIPTGGTGRANDVAYDPADGVVLVGNDQEKVPFETFISVTTRTIIGKMMFTNYTGLQQTVWNPADGLVYMSVPGTSTNPGGEVDVINPKSMKLVQVYPLPKNYIPNGMALGPNQQLLLVQSPEGLKANGWAETIVMNATNGKIVATIPQVGGGDEVWYNPGDNRFYIGANQMTVDGSSSAPGVCVVGVIDAATDLWVENIPTGCASSLAADPSNNHLFVPESGVGVSVYADLASLNEQVNSISSQLSTLGALRDQVSTLTIVAYGAAVLAVISLAVALVWARKPKRA
jgi:hypothetical protein